MALFGTKMLSALVIAVFSTLVSSRQHDNVTCRYDVGVDAIVCGVRANQTSLLSGADITRRRPFKRLEIVGTADDDCQLTSPVDVRFNFEEVSLFK